MLVLTRKLGEVLKIGDDIELTILGISGNQVRLGINAPKDVPVDREEIYLRKKAGHLPPVNCSADPSVQTKPVITVKRSNLRAKQFGLQG